jgi:cation transport ATPase
MLLELMALGGLWCAGRKWQAARAQQGDAPALAVPAQPQAPERRQTRLATAALGLAVGGAGLGTPWLGLASLPLVLWVSAPLYGGAWRGLRQRQAAPELLDAARVTLCVALGYSVVAALDAWLQSVGRGQLAKAERRFHAALQETVGASAATAWVWRDGCEVETPAAQLAPGMVVVLRPGDVAPAAGRVAGGAARARPRLSQAPAQEVGSGAPLAAGWLVTEGQLHLRLEQAPPSGADIRAELEQAVLAETLIQRLGERNGEKMAPWMLGAFALSVPLLGVSRAGVFLTTRFGAQMGRLGPHTTRRALDQGARHGIFIRDPRAFELAPLVNLVIIEASVLRPEPARRHAAELIGALRRRWPAAAGLSRRFAVHVLAETEAEGRALAEALGFDDYLVEPSALARARLVRDLQMAGRHVCYVGRGDTPRDAAALGAALLGVAHCPDGVAGESAAKAVLSDPELRGLAGLFELAAAFAARQGGNLFTQYGVDLLDISTTVFLNFGLLYSVLLSHAGLLASAAGSGYPRPRSVAKRAGAGEAPEEPPTLGGGQAAKCRAR